MPQNIGNTFPYDFSKSNTLVEHAKFFITHKNCEFDEVTRTWSCELPNFFINNRADYRQIVIQSFIYFRPNGTSDIGTTFHSSDLYDQEYSQSELDYFVGLSGTSIAGTYTLNTRRRKFTFWFKDYQKMDERYGKTEEYTDDRSNLDLEGDIQFFIQCELIY